MKARRVLPKAKKLVKKENLLGILCMFKMFAVTVEQYKDLPDISLALHVQGDIPGSSPAENTILTHLEEKRFVLSDMQQYKTE